MKSIINLLLLTTVTACVPILSDRSTRIPMYPEETWNLQISDTQNKEIVNRNCVLHGQSLSYDSLKYNQTRVCLSFQELESSISSPGKSSSEF